MAKNLKHENEVEYYYDSHPLPEEEELVGVTAFHTYLVNYVVQVLKWLLREQRCAIYENLNFYRTRNPLERPVAPDIAVIKGVDHQFVTSWTLGRTRPAPQVVFEAASKETWKIDVDEKPPKYALLGVREYFFYDPNDPPLSPQTPSRLRGWSFNPLKGMMEELQVDEQGRLWSQYLESFLVPDGRQLRLYDTNMQLRLTAEEAFAQERDAALQEKDAALQEKDAAVQRAEALIQKLRSLGVNPDEI